MPTVVVGYVPKPEGVAAVDRGIEEARLRGLKLIVVNSHRGGREYNDETLVQYREQLTALETRLVDSGIEFDLREMVRGFEPAEDLISVAESNDAALIVIGLRRRTPVGKLILGSNAQRILLDAPCPVLAVKGS